MDLVTVVASLALIIVVGLALRYIIKEKKGNKCVGCPYAGECCKYSPREIDELAAEITAKISAGPSSCCRDSGK